MILEMLSFPFMQRALIAGVILGLLLASLGVIATLRNMAFFGDGIAHASLAGIAIAIFAGFTPLPVAILWSVFIALLIFSLERATKLPSDTLIGILFTSSMALGVIIMNFTPGYQPDLISFLFGSILAITKTDLIVMATVSAVILTWFFSSLKSLTYLSLSEDAAIVRGINVPIQTLFFYLSLAIATVLGVKILGIILVSALIVLPPAASRLMTRSFKSYFAGSILIAEFVIVAGLVLSYLFDLPSGAVIVLVGAALFLLASLISPKAR